MSDASYRVLVAEDEATFGLTVARFLEKHGHEVKICPSAKAVFKFLAAQEWDVLLLDLKLPDAEGVDILAKVRKDHPELQTIIVTGFANVQSAIESMRLGAFDYLTKPPNFEELGMRVEKAAEKTLLERENRRLRFQVQRGLSSDILTRSPLVQKVLRTLEMVAAAKTPILIEGESGVGKELVAQHLHRLSPRSDKAFVDLNCAAVPASLLESELFGHERGAFTGAGNEKPGLVEVADGGTLFLDEVGEMATEIQSKFLRVLDSGTFYRVGATRKRRADFRLVAATNRDLAGRGGGGPVPQGPLLPHPRGQGRDPAPAGSARGHPVARGALRAAAPGTEAVLGGRPGRVLRPRLAGQRARAALRGGAGGPPFRGRGHRARGPAPRDPRALGSAPGHRPGAGLWSGRWRFFAARSSRARSFVPLRHLRPTRRPRHDRMTLRKTKTTTSAGTGPTPPACARRSRRAVGVGSRPPSCSAFPRGRFTVG